MLPAGSTYSIHELAECFEIYRQLGLCTYALGSFEKSLIATKRDALGNTFHVEELTSMWLQTTIWTVQAEGSQKDEFRARVCVARHK